MSDSHSHNSITNVIMLPFFFFLLKDIKRRNFIEIEVVRGSGHIFAGKVSPKVYELCN